MKKTPHYGPEIKARAKELREAGMSYRAIARQLKIPSPATVRYWINVKAVQLAAQYYQQNHDSRLQYNTEYYQRNRAYITQRSAQYQAQYRKQNPEKHRAKQAKRRADKKKATPPWFTKEHKCQCEALHTKALRLEQETGTPYHVDHIYPITGKTKVNGKYQHTSCGLHVPWNLQVLPGPENLSKRCKIPDPAVDPPTAW